MLKLIPVITAFFPMLLWAQNPIPEVADTETPARTVLGLSLSVFWLVVVVGAMIAALFAVQAFRKSGKSSAA